MLTLFRRLTAPHAITRKEVRARSSSCSWSLSYLPMSGWWDSRTRGKSTLISTISAAKPKIADSPLHHSRAASPESSIAGDFRTFVVADIPGLRSKGRTWGAGLGDRFLRHIERTKLLLHWSMCRHSSDETQCRIMKLSMTS